MIDDIARTVAPDPDRIIGFAWIEPSLPDAVEAVDYALGEKGLKGVKMIPNHWYPADEAPQACYAKINEYGKPMLFHSGILWGTSNTSQYCRPAFYEIMLHYPNIRFALAHMSWPWTDECFAVCGKFRAAGGYKPENWRSFADMTSGAPRVWKTDAVRKGLYYMGDRQLLYGSDCFDPEDPGGPEGKLRDGPRDSSRVRLLEGVHGAHLRHERRAVAGDCRLAKENPWLLIPMSIPRAEKTATRS